MMGERLARFREVTTERAAEFLSKGYKLRHFFPHRIYYVPKGGPDGLKLARRMVGRCAPSQLWEVVLYATGPVVDQFPKDLFFDDDIVWHQQQFGRAGQVATANLVRAADRLYSMAHVSDLVQRIARCPQYRTQIDTRFKGWPYLLLNAILNFAAEQRLQRVYVPTAALAMQHTDRARHVREALFERIYDWAPQRLFGVRREGDWWAIDVTENRHRLIAPVARLESIPCEKTICVSHDIERGFGHAGIDSELERFAHAAASQHLDAMLAIEAEHGVRATYNVLGMILSEARERIEQHGHCIAFHSYDHRVQGSPTPWSRLKATLHRYRGMMVSSDSAMDASGQLARCREVDYRIKGYRPAQSRLTPELSDENLGFYNFEWLASSARSLQTQLPQMRNGIVRVPILFDDFPLYSRRMPFAEWAREAMERIPNHDFVCFGLHDCYGHLWLPHYRAFLERLGTLGRLKTVGEVVNEVTLTSAL